jgi:hypothetical protein
VEEEDAGCVYQQPGRSQLLLNLRAQFCDRAGVTDIAHKWSCIRQSLGGHLNRWTVHIDERDDEAVLRQSLGDRSTYASASASDQSDPALGCPDC